MGREGCRWNLHFADFLPSTLPSSLAHSLTRSLTDGAVLVPAYKDHDLFGSISEFEGRHRLIHAVARGSEGGDDARLGIASERVCGSGSMPKSDTGDRLTVPSTKWMRVGFRIFTKLSISMNFFRVYRQIQLKITEISI